MSQLPEAARKEIPAVGMRKQGQWADPRPARSPKLVALSQKWLYSTALDGSPNPPQDIVPTPARPLAGIHATDPLLPQRQVPRNRKRGEAAASVYKPNAKGTEPSTFPPKLASVANDSLGPRLFVKVGTPAWRAVERFRPSPPKPRSTDLGRIRLGGTATVELMERKRKGVLKKFWD
ncbi:hypothetical protein FRC04_007531 [Tulasnella sp. 424]|nr:hypothetical protein FRC04_007531 [Tulasnella sp. 424]KAG8960338.1 hypothetical protein FRC05_006977 [Tulasnella sp. 425]